MPQHFSIDGEGAITNFEAMRHALGEGSFQREKDLAVIATRIVFWLDIHRAHEAAVLAGTQVSFGAHVSVVEAMSGRLRNK